MAMKNKQTPRGLRNNNPGNIRISGVKYKGEIKSLDSAFKQFESIEYGYRAVFMLLHTYNKKYSINTIEGMINRYAPSCENHTDKYINVICENIGIAKNAKIDTTDISCMVPVVCVISFIENGINANEDEVQRGWALFIKDV